ncbi:hypothetical protein GUJ93_ZPchr0006g43005 [Zizania palustris]|uniref:Phytocyanin domain-containing protein n=1 Tax=Zizania palustris TaxID=103762 RepID=A0A8J5W224_ZIZPA|nr:hypothetical protein GUJ93_ZPchr0006g43005 [Zizania palustris]
MASLVVFAAAAFVLLAGAVSVSSSTVYTVGDERGWAVPSSSTVESYNHWAKRNRFQVGDVLDFRYVNDSVLVVNHDDYKQCKSASPVSRFTDGDTKFTFDRYGLFFFICGVPAHCEEGQRMIVRVMAESALSAAPSTAPTPTSAPPPFSASGAPSPVVDSVPDTPSSASSSIPSPAPEPSGASGRVLTGFSIAAAVLVVCVVTVFVMV